MKIIRITLKEGGESKVILFKQKTQNSTRTFPSKSGRHLFPKGRRSWQNEKGFYQQPFQGR